MARICSTFLLLCTIVKLFAPSLTLWTWRSSLFLLQAFVYSSRTGGCAAFLSNYHFNWSARVTFNDMHYVLPPWSISILPDCKHVVYNTATVSQKNKLFNLSICILKENTKYKLFCGLLEGGVTFEIMERGREVNISTEIYSFKLIKNGAFSL